VKRWIFRLNYDRNNDSCAFFDFDRLSVAAVLRREYDGVLESNENNVGPWYSRPVQLSVRKRVMHALKNELAKITVFSRHDIYGTLEVYYKYLKQYGGLIEAEPLETNGYVLGMCFIDPHGAVHVAQGVELLMDDKYQIQGYLGPQTITPKKALVGATTAIASYLHANYSATGYLTVEYMSFWDSLDEVPRLAAIGFRFGMHAAFSGLGTAAVAVSPGLIPSRAGLATLAPGIV
jgi:hypothetical protein